MHVMRIVRDRPLGFHYINDITLLHKWDLDSGWKI